MDLTFRTLGAWGAGKGANLTPSEVDTNFWELAQAIVDLAASPAVPVGIASITVSGTQMTITLTDGSVMGPFTLPVLTFRWRGEFQPFTTYAVLDVFTVTNTGIYMVQVAHTTGATFDANLLVPPTTGSAAYLMLFGSTDASLSALPDVLLTALADEDFLTWDAPSAKWQNIGLGHMAYQQPAAVAITGGTVTGLPVPTHPTDAATKAYVDAGPAGSTVADSTMMSNIVGSAGPAIPNTLSAFLDHVLTTTRGALLYRGGTGWLALAPGTSGLFLRTAGAGADPTWAAGSAGVTSIAAGTGITTGGSAITTTGTVGLAAIADSNLLGNASGASAAPVPLTITQFLDHAVSGARGTVLTRNVTGWVALAPGTSGTYLQSAGTGADLLWGSPLGAGTVTSVAAGTGLTAVPSPIVGAGTISFAQVSNGTLLANISGSTAAPVASTLSLILDTILSSTQGAVLYRGASTWGALAPGTSGQVLTTGGAAANPSWASSSGAAPIAASNILANLTAGSAVALGHTLSDTLDYIVSSSRGTLLFRGASGWAGLAPGTSGQVLSTGGTSGDPSWIAAPTGGGTGGLINRRIFTASTTYTPTAGTNSVIVTVIAGGGGGGGVSATSATQQAQGPGGGSGGVVQKRLTTGFSGVTITVGSGGPGNAGTNGTAGGASSFGSFTAGGGTGGANGIATSSTGTAGGAGGTATGADLNIPGSRGGVGGVIVNGGGASSGRGGDTPLGYGSGGGEQLSGNTGANGSGYGSGGGGALNDASTVSRAGGNGTAGLVIVDEYS